MLWISIFAAATAAATAAAGSSAWEPNTTFGWQNIAQTLGDQSANIPILQVVFLTSIYLEILSRVLIWIHPKTQVLCLELQSL